MTGVATRDEFAGDDRGRAVKRAKQARALGAAIRARSTAVARAGRAHQLDTRSDPRRSLAKVFRVEEAPPRKWIPKPLFDGSFDWGFLAAVLETRYGSPRHGNPHDPLDCLIYVMLTRKTPIEVGKHVLARLKRAFPTWDALLRAKLPRLVRLLQGSGLEEIRAADLRGVLGAVRSRLGVTSLEALRRWNNRRCFEFLTSLPGVGAKTARCVMLYTLGRRVFPADAHCIRVLTRLGLLREGLEHREAQALLADEVPGKHAYCLHVNLIAHGQQMCHALNPECEQCVVRKLCQHQRAQQAALWSSQPEMPAALDLFAGAGGTSLGLQWAGYRILGAVDNDLWACQTFRLNHPELPHDRVVCRDIRKVTGRQLEALLGKKRPDLIIGGPPCQAYSIVGRARRHGHVYRPTQDVRQRLYIEYLQILADHRPVAFVVENVKGLLSARLRRQRVFDRILEDLQVPAVALRREGRCVRTGNNPSYRIYSLVERLRFTNGDVRHSVVAAERFGIPQTRHRVILLGLRDDLGPITPGILAAREEVASARVLHGLPAIRSGFSRREDSGAAWVQYLRSQAGSRWANAGIRRVDSENLVRRVKDVPRHIEPPAHGRGAEVMHRLFRCRSLVPERRIQG